jgi:hypothetical protein
MTSTTPQFTAPRLSQLVARLESRRRAIRYHASRLSVQREMETDGTERLNADVIAGQPRPVDLRLSLWSDDQIWFRACRPGPRRQEGWDFMLAFHGDATAIGPERLVELLEKSLARLSGSVAMDDLAGLVELWNETTPTLERLEGLE